MSIIAYKLEEVALVFTIFVILLLPTAVRSPFNVVVPETVSLEALVVASVEVPWTVNSPVLVVEATDKLLTVA